MTKNIIQELASNAALLLALGFFYIQIVRHWATSKVLAYSLNGILFGGVAIGVMLSPLHLLPGVVFDTRSVVISVGGLFGGPIVAAITFLMASTYRIWQGGAGALMGVLVSFFSAALGTSYYFWKRSNPKAMQAPYLYGFGLLVHIVMLACALALPGDMTWRVLADISLPVIAIYPVATLLLCLLISERESRVKTEALLRESEQRYRIAVESSTDGVVILQGDCYIHVNQRFAEMMGYTSPTEIIGQPLSLLVHSDDLPRVSDYASSRQRGQEAPTRYTFKGLRKDGREIYLEASVGVIEMQGASAALVYIRDVTQRMMAEEALRLSEEKLRLIADHIYDWEYWISPELGLLFVSPSCKIVTGFRPEEFSGDVDLIGRIVHPADRELWELHEAELRTDDGLRHEGEHVDFRIITKGGEVRWLSHRCHPVFGAEGKFLGRRVSNRDISDRKQAEERLRESSERISALFNATSDSVILLDADCNILAINEHGAKRRGMRPEEMLGKPLCDLLPPHLAQGRKARIEDIVRTGQPILFTEERDGNFYLINMVPVLDSSGAVSQIASFSRDVTELRRSEEHLHRVNRELRAVSQCNQALIRATDEQELLQDVCRIICNEAGYSMAWVGLAEDDEAKSVRPAAWQGKEDGYLVQASITWADTEFGQGPIGTAIRTGQPCAIMDFAIDPQAKPWREQALQRGYRSCVALPLVDNNRKAFGALNIYSTLPDAFTPEEIRLLGELGADLAFGILFLRARVQQDRMHSVNAARVRLLQFAATHSLDELLEETLNEAEAVTGSLIGFYHFVEEDQKTLCLQNWSTRTKAEFCKAEGKGLHYGIAQAGVWTDCVHQRRPVIHNDYALLSHRKGLPPGHAEVVRQLVVPVLRGDQIRAILGIGNKAQNYTQDDVEAVSLLADLAWDIAERKLAEKAKAELEAQLRQAQKMEAIGTLAGGIAHDFNNILGAVLGFAEIARDDAQAGKSDPSDLDKIIAAAGRAKELVKQVMTFSRKAELNLQPLDLNKVVQGTRAILERTLPKMISIETNLADDLPTVQADPTQVEQVLLNLATNAADAMPNGGRLVLETQRVVLDHEYCRQHLEFRPGLYVVLLVTDTGLGMDEKTRERIFEPFFTTKEIGKGTGLGLSTAYGIIKTHGGLIQCYSEEGEGTTFKISLPVLQEKKLQLIEERMPANEEALGGAETILLVDDEEALRQLGAHSLRSKGYQVLTATSGEEALKIYREKGNQLDLVIMDLGMPGMGGHKCLKEILAINPQAKVVIASGYSSDTQVKAALDSGAAGYLAKPFRSGDLLNTVRSVLDKK